MSVQIYITADVTGAFWWPIGEEWEKPFQVFDVTTHESRCTGGGRADGRLTLRQAVDSFISEHAGDSSNGIVLRDAVLTVTRVRSGRRVSRDFPLTMFPSVSDFLEKEEV